MRLCLYNGSKKKKTAPKKTKKSSASTTKPVNKKQNNGTLRTTEASKSKKTDKKKKTPVLVEVALDPPLLSKLTLSQCKGKSNESSAINFWKFVEAYTSVITKEDINYINSLTKVYSKENCPFMNMIPSSNTTCSPDFPEDWLERIVGALVDPDLFPPEDDDSDGKRMRTDDLDCKRLRLCDPIESMGVFSDRSNLPAYLNNMGPVCIDDDDEEDAMTNCDMKSHQDEGDEISEEILKCQEELRLVCRQNEKTLSVLASRAQRQLESQQLKGLRENELVKLMQ